MFPNTDIEGHFVGLQISYCPAAPAGSKLQGLLSPALPNLANLSFCQDLPSILDPSDARQLFALNPSNISLLRTLSLATHAAHTLPCPPSSLPLKNLFTFCEKPSLTWQYLASSSVIPTWLVSLISLDSVSACASQLCWPPRTNLAPCLLRSASSSRGILSAAGAGAESQGFL